MKDLVTDFTTWLYSLRELAVGDVAFAALAIAVYVVAGNIILRPSYSLRAKAALFGVLNLAATYTFFFHSIFEWPPVYKRESVIQFALYAGFACSHWLLIAALARTKGNGVVYLAALAYPLLSLLLMKVQSTWHLIGFSYMAFRMAQAAFESKRDPGLGISFSSYAAFLFFPLTIPIGPISPYGYFSRGLANGVAPSLVSIARGLVRIVLGYVMLRFLATIAFQTSYGGMWQDGFRHGVGDVLIASYSSLAYLYFNFAGFTHIVIGAAALIGMPVKENFDSPVLSRSIKEFWNRWHITLSEFVRDIVYTPIAVALTRLMGPALALMAAMVAGMATFVVIGLWHGTTLGFLIFGLMHGAGFCLNLAFDAVTRKTRKGPVGAFLKGPVWQALCWVLTMTYIALSIVVIEFSTIEQINTALSVFDPKW